MILKDYQKKILELLEQLELEMSNLYRLFADKYPQHKDTWNIMVQEEIEHAEIIKRLSSLAGEGKAIFDEKMTKTYTVQIFIDNIKKLYTEVETNKTTLLKALALSNDFEQSIIEKKFYSYFLTNDLEVKTVINRVIQDTGSHSLRIRKILDIERNR